MVRPLSRARRLQHAAFLKALRRTGNVREAARIAGAPRATLFKRRAAYPAFAAEWDAALTLAAAALAQGDARVPEPEIVRRYGGRLQLRRRAEGRLTPEARSAFLAALSASANVRLSAAAAGFTHAAFYAPKRRDPGFAREWRLALQQGYDTLELALLETFAVEASPDDAWRHNAPPAIPPMSAAQARQLMCLHQKEARFETEPFPIKRRRGESVEAHSYRLSILHEQRLERMREDYRRAEAERQAARERPGPHEPPPPMLPDLGQVTGWSKADPTKPPHDPDTALFGGWRIQDWAGWEA
jgi:hypothetical protein